VVVALGLGKHLYGGLGNNPFNPAVVGYAFVLLSFPAALAEWPTATDGLSGATALTTFKYREGLTVADVWQPEFGFGTLGGHPAELLNLAFLAGGLVLAWRRLVAWRVPVALLGTLGLLALVGYDQGSSSSLGGPLYHGFSGATMLAAWFFATDPVTHPASARGQILFGCLIGAIAFAIRSFGSYPDGLAFGILLANGCAAWLDRPRMPITGAPPENNRS
jgi:electron transport complex protein RnfD